MLLNKREILKLRDKVEISGYTLVPLKVYFNKNETIVSFRHSLNIKDGVMPALYSYYFGTTCILGYAGRENFNVSCRITGCGFLIPTRMVENGWNYLGITEDMEFSGNTILDGNTIHYCDEAIFYD